MLTYALLCKIVIFVCIRSFYFDQPQTESSHVHKKAITEYRRSEQLSTLSKWINWLRLFYYSLDCEATHMGRPAYPPSFYLACTSASEIFIADNLSSYIHAGFRFSRLCRRRTRCFSLHRACPACTARAYRQGRYAQARAASVSVHPCLPAPCRPARDGAG